MTDPAKCHCGSISWERRIEESRYICCSCKRPLWQPIETAPKDGSAILTWPAKSSFTGTSETMTISYVVRWNDWKEAWIEASGEEYDTFYPTHWMPMPEGPGDE